MINTLMVDGQNLLKIAFHGDKETFTKEFGYIGAIKTFYTIIKKVIAQYSINKVIIFWDGEHSGKLRYLIYPKYKSNRDKDWDSDGILLTEKDVIREENADRSILLQRIRIQNYAQELFFRQVEDPVCEADDCIAYYVKNCMQKDEKAYILSADADFCQLISDNVYIYSPKLKGLLTPRTYFLFYNHIYQNSALIKAIVGCDTDTIYGVEKMGEKTLLDLFPELKTRVMSFDEIYEQAKEINAARLGSKKKPLKTLLNLIEGKTAIENTAITNGKHLFDLNFKLVNLREPFMTNEAIELVESHGNYPLTIENRGGKNLLRLMYEDGFIHTIYGGPEGYVNWITDFLPVVNHEKTIYKNYLESLKK